MDIGIDMPFDHGTELLVAVVLVRRVVLPRQDVVLGRDLYPLFGTAAALAHCLRCFETIDANFFFPFVLQDQGCPGFLTFLLLLCVSRVDGGCWSNMRPNPRSSQ